MNSHGITDLRVALNHLYEPKVLRECALAEALGLADRPNTASALRDILIVAIESLRPSTTQVAPSRMGRMYELLFYRYVQQFSQQEVADQLKLSVRHLRREQNEAIEILASWLEERHHLAGRSRSQGVGGSSDSEAMASTTLNSDLSWLRESGPEQQADLSNLLSSVVKLVRGLASQYEASLQVDQSKSSFQVAAHPVALRQIVLGLLEAAIQHAGSGTVRLSIIPQPPAVRVTIQGKGSSRETPERRHADLANRDMIRKLTELCHIRLNIQESPGAFVSDLILPAIQQCPVLLIDDNCDALQLVERYLAGTRYHAFTLSNPGKLFSPLPETLPEVIVLDVMMPAVDGWEVLGQLRNHPATERIPVVICTILPQEELSRSLGASDFIRKPFTRQDLLKVLDRVLASQATTRR